MAGLVPVLEGAGVADGDRERTFGDGWDDGFHYHPDAWLFAPPDLADPTWPAYVDGYCLGLVLGWLFGADR